jgi:hypothetical protein
MANIFGEIGRGLQDASTGLSQGVRGFAGAGGAMEDYTSKTLRNQRAQSTLDADTQADLFGITAANNAAALNLNTAQLGDKAAYYSPEMRAAVAGIATRTGGPGTPEFANEYAKLLASKGMVQQASQAASSGAVLAQKAQEVQRKQQAEVMARQAMTAYIRNLPEFAGTKSIERLPDGQLYAVNEDGTHAKPLPIGALRMYDTLQGAGGMMKHDIAVSDQSLKGQIASTGQNPFSKAQPPAARIAPQQDYRKTQAGVEADIAARLERAKAARDGRPAAFRSTAEGMKAAQVQQIRLAAARELVKPGMTDVGRAAVTAAFNQRLAELGAEPLDAGKPQQGAPVPNAQFYLGIPTK